MTWHPRALADAARLLPPIARGRVSLLQAWWHDCAAMVGNPDTATLAARVAQARQSTARALAGEPTGAAGFHALAAVAADCDFSRAQTDDVITGLALDAAGWRPASEIELLGYAYHAGGAPGVLVMRAMGIAGDDGEMLDCACDGGVALVLGRLARDLARGAPNAGRLLPGDWLARSGIDASHLLLPAHRVLRKAIAARWWRLADPYAVSARYGAAHLPFRCRWATAALLAPLSTGVRGQLAGVPGPVADRLSGLIQALRHGPEQAQVPLARAALARVINSAMGNPAMWTRPVDAAGETAAPAR